MTPPAPPKASRRAAAGARCFALAALSACGCEATLVESRRPRRGPVAEVGVLDPGGGEVKYSLDGWAWVVRRRREDALARMEGACGGKGLARVLDEVDREAAEAGYAAGDIEENISAGARHYGKGRYRHVTFECAAPPAAARRASEGVP